MTIHTTTLPADHTGLAGLVDRLGRLPDQRVHYYEGRSVRAKTFTELQADVRAVEQQLTDHGVRAGTVVGLLAENSYDWVVHDLALLELGAVTVALPADELRDTPLDELRQSYRLELLLLSPREARRHPNRASWVTVLGRLDDAAAPCPLPEAEPLSADIFTMAFSSGSTGRLKCILLGRRGTEALISAYGYSYTFRPDDSILVVLPLSAFQQRLMVYAAIWYGFDVALADVVRMSDALTQMRPTILAGPPVFYEMLENRFLRLPSRQRAHLLAVAHVARLIRPARLRARVRRKLFAPFHAAYGGRMRLMLVGSAPSRISTLRLFQLLGFPLYEVYGLTETGFISWNLPGRNRPGSVGRLVFPETLRLAPDGEILVRYPEPQSHGYLGVPAEEEAAVYRPDGWIATGDIGRVDRDGYLHLVGRKKSIIITRGGYKLQPEPVERELATHPAVARAVVVGGDDLPVLAAVVSLRDGASAQAAEEVRRLFREVNDRLAAGARLSRLVLTHQEFTRENGLLTRNLKVDRAAVVRYFATEIATGASDATRRAPS